MKIGFIGLGRMGGNMVLKLLEGGHSVVVWNRSAQRVEEFKSQISKVPTSSAFGGLRGASKTTPKNLKVAKTIRELVESLEKPRIVWVMVTAGETTDEVLNEIANYVESGDIVIDGSNANYKDTERRYKELKTKDIRFLGIGVSGGVHGPKLGYALMAGGDKSAYEYVVPILDTLVKPTAGHEYYGEGGAGHFVKMMHNAIEYGYMQSIGEGFDVLEHAPYKLDLLKIAKQWAKQSLVSGFMMDRTVDALSQPPILSSIEGNIDATGEAQWAVETAKELGVPVEIIERSLEYRKRSKTDRKIQKSFTAKMVAALRRAFGAHGVKKKD